MPTSQSIPAVSAFKEWLTANRNFRPNDLELLIATFETVAACAPLGWTYAPGISDEDRDYFGAAIETRVDWILTNINVAAPEWGQKSSDAFHYTQMGHALNNALYNVYSYDLWDVTAAATWLYGGYSLDQKVKQNVVQIAKIGKLRMYLKPSWIKAKQTNFVRKSLFQALPVEPAIQP